MIILSGVLVVVAIALLVTGIVTGNTGHEVAGLDGLKLIYVSIGVSIISALCLAIGVFLRRKELFGTAESEASTKRSAASRSTKTARTAKAKARVGAGDDAPVVTMTPTAATEVPAETSVFVVPGRKRYHLETCRQLAGRDKEELTFVEAREEGFTACTACLPDTALAARAAFTESDATDSAPTESLDSVTDTTDLTPAADDPALVTRTDLPVTKLDTDTEPDKDQDTSLDTREVEPAAQSPAAAELTEAPESGVAAETETSADTTRFDEIPETEAASEPAAERSLARSRSLFEPLDDESPDDEPLDHEDSVSTEDTAPPEDATTEHATTEHATTEDAAADEHTADDEDLAALPALSEPEDDAEDTTADRHVDTEPEEAEPADESPAESADATEIPVADDEATDEPATELADEVEHDSATDEPAGTETGKQDTPPADEAEDEAPHEDADTAGIPDLPFVRILSGTKRYHRPDCALIEDIAEDADDLETLSPAEAKERGCTPCLVCQPDKDPSDDQYY